MKLYKRGNIWWVTYGTNPRRRVSTGLEDRTQAEAYAMRIVAPAMADNAAALLERAAMLRRDAADQRAGLMRLDRLFNVDEYRRRHSLRESSAGIAADKWRLFRAFCAGRGAVSVGDLTPALCRDFLDGLGARSAQIAFYACRRILRDAGCREDLFAEFPKRGTGEAAHREPLTPEQVAALLARIDALAGLKRARGAINGEFPQFVRLMLYTGLRLGDAATLTAGMYDASSNCLRRTMAKTGRTVEFPVHPSIRDHLARRAAEAADGAEPVFPAVDSLYRRDRWAVTRHFSRVMASAGLAGQYCAHCLRATFAAICAEHGVPLAVIQSWLGHTSPMVTRIYARIEDLRRKREAMERFPDLG